MDIDVLDVRRMFLGDLPWTFLVEIVVRTAIMYTFAFLLVRVMSRQVTQQLTLVEVLLIVALGSAVGDPMFSPDVPLLHGMAVIATVVSLNQGFAALVRRSAQLEVVLEGRPSRVVYEGRLDVNGVRGRGLATDELFELLRSEGVEHLGQVRVAYIEQSGLLSVFRYPSALERPGLAIEPPEILVPGHRYCDGDIPEQAGAYACCACGEVQTVTEGHAVGRCGDGHTEWTDRVKAPTADPPLTY